MRLQRRMQVLVVQQKSRLQVRLQAAFRLFNSRHTPLGSVHAKFANRPVLSPSWSIGVPMRSSIASQRLLSGVLLR